MTSLSNDITGKDNELIARFMKVGEITQHFDSYGIKKPIYWTEANNFRTRTYDLPDMSIKDFINESKYHTSWDWLMPVVEKINKTKNKYGSTDVIIYRMTCHVNDPEQIIVEATGKNMMEATYKAVVEFIKWHNANTPKP